MTNKPVNECVIVASAQLENAQRAAAKSGELLSSTMEELRGTKLMLDSLSAQLSQSQKQVLF